MHNKREDLSLLHGEEDAMAIYNDVKASDSFVEFALTYMHDDDKVARNALWVLTKATDKELSQFQSIIDRFIDLAMSTENSSVRRLSMNIIDRLKINKDDIRTDFLDFCLEHAVDLAEYPGIQSLAIKLANKMCSFYPELKKELISTLEAMEIEHYKPAVKSIRSRILKFSK